MEGGERKDITKNYVLQATSIYLYTAYLVDQSKNM